MGLENFFFKLMGTDVVECKDVTEYTRWISAEHDGYNPSVGDTDIPGKAHAIRVSTIFLGMNQRPFRAEGHLVPLVFETRIFGGGSDGTRFLWATYEEAERGHRAIVACLQADLSVDDLEF